MSVNKKRVLTPNEQDCVITVRSLVNSLKPPVYLSQILKDFVEVEGHPINYRELGYDSVERFLGSTGEFILTRHQGGLLIQAVPNANSNHIVKLVREQKATGGAARRIKSTKKKSYNNVLGGNRNAYNNYGWAKGLSGRTSNNVRVGSIPKRNQNDEQYRKIPAENRGAFVKYTEPLRTMNTINNRPEKFVTGNKQFTVNNTTNNSNSNRNPSVKERIPATSKPEEKNYQLNKNNHVKENINKILSKSQDPDMKSSVKKTPSHHTSSTSQPESSLRPILGQKPASSNANSQAAANMNISVQRRLQSGIGGGASAGAVADKGAGGPSADKGTGGGTTASKATGGGASASKATGGGAIASASKGNTDGHMNSVRSGSILNGLARNNSIKTENMIPIMSVSTEPAIERKVPVVKPSFKFNYEDPVDSIRAFCKQRGYQKPDFTFHRTKENYFSGQVEIDGKLYSTYPKEYATKPIAAACAAKKAFQQIMMQESVYAMPMYPHSDHEFIVLLYGALRAIPSGIISHKLPEWFLSKFGSTPPKHWLMLIKSSNLFSVDKGASEIITAQENIPEDDNTIDVTPSVIIDPDLPWEKKTWNVYVEHCVSTTEIWIRLFGKEFSDRFQTLLGDIAKRMKVKKTRAVTIIRKHIYLAFHDRSWHRVRVEAIQGDKEQALCYFLDYGDTEWLPASSIYFCEPEFLSQPAQAIPFSLYGLEDFATHPYAAKYLTKHLKTHCLIAEIHTKKEEFQEKATIQVVLFDTSTADDLDMNTIILRDICNNVPNAKLEKTLSEVSIKHITDDGHIFVQPHNRDAHYVENLLQNVVTNRLNAQLHQCNTPDSMHYVKTFLVNDENYAPQQKWYRARLVDENEINKENIEKFTMYYLDYGVERPVEIKNIYNLDKLSAALSKFPEQAIEVKLHNVEINKSTVGRIRALLPINCVALVRHKLTENQMPIVTIFRRVGGPDSMLCNINDDLFMESEKIKESIESSNNDMPSSPNSPGSDITSHSALFRSVSLAVPPTSPLRLGDLLKLKPYPSIPSVGMNFDVCVCVVSNPSDFRVHPYNEDYKSLKRMMSDLQSYCSENEEFIPPDMVEIGQAYAAKNPNGLYHRVVAIERCADIIHVSFCDFGDNLALRSDHLKVLPTKYRQLPIMGIKAKLFNLEPMNEDWSKEECSRFCDMVNGKCYSAIIKHHKIDDSTVLANHELTLELIDVSTDVDINISDILINEGIAKPIITQ